MRPYALWVLAPALAHAGVTYDLHAQLIPAPHHAPVVQRFYIDGDRLRSGAPDAKRIFLFKGGHLYMIDPPTRSIQVLRTYAEVQEEMAALARRMEAFAANAPPDRRETAQRGAAMSRRLADLQRQSLPHEYRKTDRTQSVDGHPCTVWEEYLRGVKRVELCIAPTASIPGGAEILRGMKAVFAYVRGANIMLVMEFDRTDAWPEIEKLGGVPIEVRGFEKGQLGVIITLAGMRETSLSPSLFELPRGYSVYRHPKLPN